MVRFLSLTILSSVFLAWPTWAAPITPVTQVRTFSESWSEDSYPPTFIEATDFGPFVVPGKHDSVIEDSRLAGELAAAGKAPDAYDQASQSSRYDIVFDLDVDVHYSLVGEIFNHTYVSAGSDGGGWVRLQSWDEVGATYEDLFVAYQVGDYYDSYQAFETSGDLAPGRYRLWAAAIGQGHDHSYEGPSAGSGEVSFSFQVVPEPGSAVLAATGLVVLAARRRARRARSFGV